MLLQCVMTTKTAESIQRLQGRRLVSQVMFSIMTQTCLLRDTLYFGGAVTLMQLYSLSQHNYAISYCRRGPISQLYPIYLWYFTVVILMFFQPGSAPPSTLSFGQKPGRNGLGLNLELPPIQLENNLAGDFKWCMK